MKKLTTILFAGTLLVGFSSVTMAQSTDDATINANANVVADMVVGSDKNDIEFNNILIGSGKFINAADGSVDVTAGATSGTVNGITGSEQRGWFDISIAAGTNVSLSLDVPSLLINGDQVELPVSFGAIGFDNVELNGMVTANKPTGTNTVSAITGGTPGSFSFADGLWTLATFTMPAEGDGAGTVYLALGGETFAATDQALGAYSAELTLTATVAD